MFFKNEHSSGVGHPNRGIPEEYHGGDPHWGNSQGGGSISLENLLAYALRSLSDAPPSHLTPRAVGETRGTRADTDPRAGQPEWALLDNYSDNP